MWIIDSGNAHHLTCNLHYMKKYRYVGKREIFLYTPFGQRIQITIEGKKQSRNVRLHKVWYSPDVSQNLISVSQLDMDGYRVRFFNGECIVWWKNKTEEVGKAACDVGNKLYYVTHFRALSQEERETYA